MLAIPTQTITSLQQGLRVLGPLTAAEITPLWWPSRTALTVQRHLRYLTRVGHLAAHIESVIVGGRPRRVATHYDAPTDPPTPPLRAPVRERLLSLLAAAHDLPELVGTTTTTLHDAGGYVVVLRRSLTALPRVVTVPQWIDLQTPRREGEADRAYLLICDLPGLSLDHHALRASIYARLCTPSVWPAAYPPPVPLILAATPMRLPAIRAAWRDAGFPRFLITTRNALIDDGWAAARWEEVAGLRRRDRILFEGWLPDRRIPANNDRWEPSEHWQRGPP